jgi:DNA-binding NarL/FixJ family response regulator
MDMRQPKRHSHDPAEDRASGARILYVDGDGPRAMRMREAFEIAGFPEAEHALNGDEALDMLGAAAQQFDIIVARMPLKDGDADLAGVLRRCASPVRLVALTTLTPRTFPLAGRLAGVAGVDGHHGERTIIDCMRAVLAGPHTVAEIVRSHRVPDTLSEAWARRIYGHQPGARFQAKLD